MRRPVVKIVCESLESSPMAAWRRPC